MPGQKKKVVIEDTVQNIDIYPTLAKYFSRDDLPHWYNTLEGKSLIPLLNGKQLYNKRFAVSLWANQRCIIMGDYKYWLLNGKEYVTNIKTKEEISNPVKINKLN